MEFHQACLLFPEMSDDELASLADDIRQNGLLNPIVTIDGKILDGRNRLAACKIAEVEPRFLEWAGDGSPLTWAVAVNLMRRHLTPSQRAVIAFDLLPMLAVDAKQRQRNSRGRGKKVAKNLATISGKASQIAARITSSNSAYIEKVKSISKKAPEILPAIKQGRMNLGEATRLAQEGADLRAQVLSEAAKYPVEPVKRILRRVLVALEPTVGTVPGRLVSLYPSEQGIQIWCGDCLALMRERIKDGSISVVTTSPPYNHGVRYGVYDDCREEADYLGWLDQVFGEIHRVLAVDGSLFLIAGHSPKKPWTAMRVAEVAGKRFQLQNQIAWVKSITVEAKTYGHFTPITSDRFVNRTWEFVFHFTKSGRVPVDRLALGVKYEDENNFIRRGSNLRCGGDVWFVPYTTIHGTEDRGEHPATFPSELAERCIRLAGIKPDTIVLDPFCGVTGMDAAAKLRVAGVGIDIDPKYCASARRRYRVQR